jgi:hypothetical protein
MRENAPYTGSRRSAKKLARSERGVAPTRPSRTEFSPVRTDADIFVVNAAGVCGPDHAAIANHRRISARGTTPVRSARIIPPRNSTKYGID